MGQKEPSESSKKLLETHLKHSQNELTKTPIPLKTGLFHVEQSPRALTG
jgi:hypothetical protein